VSPLVWSLGLCLTAALFTSTLACQTAQTISRRGELDVALSRHHVDIRWGRVPLAARYVHTDLQAAFVEDWERKSKEIDITEIEVLQVFEFDEGKSADVVVRFAWIDRARQSLHEATVTEHWEEVDGAWVITRMALPGEPARSTTPSVVETP
jgi:hypothetical protein